MTDLKANNRRQVVARVTIVLSLLLFVFYFLHFSYPDNHSSLLYYILRYRIALPALILVISSIILLPWQMVFAFSFCFLGDVMGASGSFIGQMASFMVAQVIFATMFVHLIWPLNMIISKEKSLDSFPKIVGIPVLVIAAILFIVFMIILQPKVDGFPVKFGIAIYALALESMTIMSIALAKKRKFPIPAIAGLLFLVSDMSLGFHKFLFPQTNMAWIVVPTYFLSILLIWYSVYRIVDEKI